MARSSSNAEVIFYFLIGGPVLLMWGLRKLKQKRLVENIATSTVRAAAMGLVELAGQAKPRKVQKAPISGVDCCWWKCQVQEYRSSGKSRHWATIKEIGSTELFYLEDATGRVLINPFGAELRVISNHSNLDSTTRTKMIPVLTAWGLDHTSWFGFSRQLRVIEQVIPDHAPVYIMGELISTADHSGDQRARLMAHLRAAKSNPTLMKQADTNQDGQVDASEWDALRARQEQEFYKEEMIRQSQGPQEANVLVKAPADHPYVIVTGGEKDLLGSLSWQAPLGLFGGVAISAFGVWLALMHQWPPLFIIGLLTAGCLVGLIFKQFKLNFWRS
jgi:hypothetical protein